MTPTFTWDVSLGSFLTLVTMIVGLAIAYGKYKRDMGVMNMKLDTIWEWFIGRTNDNPHHRRRDDE